MGAKSRPPSGWSLGTVKRHAAIAFRLMPATERARIGTEAWRREMAMILPEWLTFHLVTRELERLSVRATYTRYVVPEDKFR